MANLKLIFKIRESNLEILIKDGKLVLGQKALTISRGFDNLLITTLDNLIRDTKIDKLRIKTAQILGKMNNRSLSSMILKTVRQAIIN